MPGEIRSYLLMCRLTANRRYQSILCSIRHPPKGK